MNSFSLRLVILLLLIFPIAYLFAMRFISIHPSFDWWMVFLATFCSGPLLLLYSFLTRPTEKKLSLVALFIGLLWVGFMVYAIASTIKASYF